MRLGIFTLLSMLAAAILLMVGGERLARREVENRTPADRRRLLDFDEAFRSELVRLDALYLEHLARVASGISTQKAEMIKSEAADISGVVLIRVFRKVGKELTIQPDWGIPRLPEIEIADGKSVRDPGKAVVLNAELRDKALPEKGKWLATPDPTRVVHCRQPEPGVLVVFLIDLPRTRARLSEHMALWVETPLTPLREAGERLMVEKPDGRPLVSVGEGHHGPAASIIPMRTNFGDWQLRSWDGLVVTRAHDPATLAVATTLAVMLLAVGVALFIQQRRTLRRAAERVSFVNRVSHEFGAPLTNISLNLDLATEALESRPVEARKRLSLVAEEIERLSRLVANVLTFSRRERDVLELKPARCLPDEVIGQVLESFRPSLERRAVRIEANLSAGEPVWLDPDALSQITGNLVSNVEKYAAEGGWMGLDCHTDGGYLVLDVRDSGEGIPAGARERIFQAFERVRDGTNEGASGTGLGLAIARDLARRMGGELELVESGNGCHFRLRVPASSPLLGPDSTSKAL